MFGLTVSFEGKQYTYIDHLSSFASKERQGKSWEELKKAKSLEILIDGFAFAFPEWGKEEIVISSLPEFLGFCKKLEELKDDLTDKLFDLTSRKDEFGQGSINCRVGGSCSMGRGGGLGPG